MLKNRERNWNIDKLSKNLDINVDNNLKIINKIIIEHNQDFKRTGGVNRTNYSRLLIKRSNIKLSKLFGQKFKLIKSKKSVSNWWLRENMLVGNLLTITKKENLDNIYKWLLIYLARDIHEGKKRGNNFGVEEKRSEFIILMSDWLSSEIIEKNISMSEIKEELLKLKMLNIGLNIKIDYKEKSIINWTHSYLTLY